MFGTQTTQLDLSNGFSWYAVIKVDEQKREGRKVIYDTKQADSRLRLTIGLDADNSLRTWVCDAQGREIISDPVPATEFLNRFVLLSVDLRPEANGRVRTSLGVNNETLAEAIVELDLGEAGQADLALGGTVDSKDHAAFELAELKVYSVAQSELEKDQLWSYVREKYDLQPAQ